MLLDNVMNEQNQMEFKALERLHIHLDDDKNGDVDFSESKEVIKSSTTTKIAVHTLIYSALRL